jgi:hypothetical protein
MEHIGADNILSHHQGEEGGTTHPSAGAKDAGTDTCSGEGSIINFKIALIRTIIVSSNRNGYYGAL